MIRAAHTSFSFALRLRLLTASFGIVGTVAAAPVIWTGPTITFTKSTINGDPTLAMNQDHLTDNVILTRGFSQGMYNIAKESSYDKFSGAQAPTDTQWATVVNNPSATIAATNYAALSFTSWAAAYGGPSFELQGNITADNAVVHLVTDDIYLDLKFTQFTSGGFFAYQRSTAAPSTTGDYNGNLVVDAADYTIWRGTFGQTVSSGAGADGNGNGMIDSGDYDFWKARFGNLIAGAGSGAALSAAVPEPTSLALSALGGLLLAALCAARQIRQGPA